MNKKELMTRAAFAVALLALATQVSAHGDPFQAKEKKGYEKCLGIAKMGENDCSALDGSHMCAGLSEKDNLPTEWQYVKKGTCLKLGGKFLPKKLPKTQN